MERYDEATMGRVLRTCIVVNGNGEPVAASDDPVDAVTFARCMGLEPALDYVMTIPVIGFEKREEARYGE